MEPYGGQGLLLVEGEWLQIDPLFDFWLDIDVLEKAFRDSEGIRGRDLEEQQSKRIQSAVELYRGNLMQGWYQDWCLYERERLQFLYLAMLDKLMDHCEAHKTYEKGLIFGEKTLQYDRARERTYRRLMRLHYLAGDRTAALRQYQRCIIALKEELDVDPADRTRLLYEKIRADQLETPIQQNRITNKKGDEMDEPLKMLFSHLNTLHQSLSQIQTQLAEDLKVIQGTIKSNQD
jgi:DNA-binding SARP family transcriptional activator